MLLFRAMGIRTYGVEGGANTPIIILHKLPGVAHGDAFGKDRARYGAGQGIGHGIAMALAKAGASVAITGRTLSKLETTCKEIERGGGTAFAVQCEVKSAGFSNNVWRRCSPGSGASIFS